MRLLIYVALLTGIAVMLWTYSASSKDTIDCGPEGKPALNGTACIDREPAYTTYP